MRSFHDCALCYLSVSLFCLSLCIINHPSICHEIPHLLDTQKGRLCLFFIWTVGDGARCLVAAECSGVTVSLTGHDEQPQMKDEAWKILERGAPLDLLPQEYTQWMRGGKSFLSFFFFSNPSLLESASHPVKATLNIQLLNWEKVTITGCLVSGHSADIQDILQLFADLCTPTRLDATCGNVQ